MGIFGGTTQSASSGSPGLFGSQDDIQRHIALGPLPSAKPAAKPKSQPKPKSNLQKIGGIFGGVAKDLAQPIVRTGEAVSQGIGNAELKVAGRPTQNAKQFSAGVPTAINKFSNYKGTKKQVGGDLLNVASDVIAPSTSSLRKGVVTGVALGAGSSAAAQKLDTGKVDLKKVGESAGLAGVLGGIGGGLTGHAANKASEDAIAAKNAANIAAKAKTAEEGSVKATDMIKKPTDTVIKPTKLSNALADVSKPGVQESTKLKPGVQTFGSKTTVLNKFGLAGKQLGSAIQNVDKTHLALRTNYENQIPTVLGLKGKSVENFWDTVEGKSDAVTPEVDKAVKEWKSLSPQVRDNAVSAGIKVGKQENFLPRSYNFKAISKNPEKYAAVLQRMVETKQAGSLPEAKSLFDSFANSTGGPNQFGHFESSRKLDIPGYNKDINTVRQYLDQGARRTAEATHLGASNEKAVALLNQINPANRGVAKEAIRNYLHTPDQSGGVNKALAGTRALFGVARLGKAALSHAGQTTNIAVSANGKALLRGWRGALSQGDRDFAKSTGVLHPSELHGLVEQATGLGGKLGRATAPGLTHVMKANRIVASVAGRHYGNALAAKGGTKALSRLQELGVTGDIGKKLTSNQEIQVARGIVKETMFDRSRANTPIKAETSVGKSVGQYRLAYGYKQTGLIYKRVVGEAKKGNLSPLLHYLAISAPVTAGTIALKNKISGSREGAGGIAADTAGLQTGIPGETAEQAARYGKKDVLKTTASTVAPIAGEGVDVGERAQKAVGGDFKPAGRYAAGLVPVVGNRVSAKEFPYGSGTAQAVDNHDKNVSKELQNLNYTVTDTSRKSGRAAKLNDTQYKNYTSQSSKLFAQKVQKALSDPQYKKLSPADKKATLQANLRDSRNVVMTKIAGKYTPTKRQKYKKY